MYAVSLVLGAEGGWLDCCGLGLLVGLRLSGLGFLHGKVDSVDGVGRTLVDTLLAELAFLKVDVGEVGSHCNGLVGA